MPIIGVIGVMISVARGQAGVVVGCIGCRIASSGVDDWEMEVEELASMLDVLTGVSRR